MTVIGALSFRFVSEEFGNEPANGQLVQMNRELVYQY